MKLVMADTSHSERGISNFSGHLVCTIWQNYFQKNRLNPDNNINNTIVKI